MEKIVNDELSMSIRLRYDDKTSYFNALWKARQDMEGFENAELLLVDYKRGLIHTDSDNHIMYAVPNIFTTFPKFYHGSGGTPQSFNKLMTDFMMDKNVDVCIGKFAPNDDNDSLAISVSVRGVDAPTKLNWIIEQFKGAPKNLGPLSHETQFVNYKVSTLGYMHRDQSPITSLVKKEIIIDNTATAVFNARNVSRKVILPFVKQTLTKAKW